VGDDTERVGSGRWGERGKEKKKKKERNTER